MDKYRRLKNKEKTIQLKNFLEEFRKNKNAKIFDK